MAWMVFPTGTCFSMTLRETDELLLAMARHVAADHCAVENVHRGEQRRRAVPLVVRHGSGATSSSAAVPAVCDQAPESGFFFVDRQHELACAGGINIERPDDVA